jgi:hypothetical protein
MHENSERSEDPWQKLNVGTEKIGERKQTEESLRTQIMKGLKEEAGWIDGPIKREEYPHKKQRYYVMYPERNLI